jgi:hypothetical protein
MFSVVSDGEGVGVGVGVGLDKASSELLNRAVPAKHSVSSCSAISVRPSAIQSRQPPLFSRTKPQLKKLKNYHKVTKNTFMMPSRLKNTHWFRNKPQRSSFSCPPRPYKETTV